MSVAVHVTDVAPTGNLTPDGNEHATCAGGDAASMAVGVVYVTTLPLGESAGTWMSAGNVDHDGGVVSATPTTAVAVVCRPDGFCTVTEMVCAGLGSDHRHGARWC